MPFAFSNMIFSNSSRVWLFFLSGVFIFNSFKIGSEIPDAVQPLTRYWQKGANIRDRRLAFEWRTSFAMRGEFFRTGGIYRFEAQSLHGANILIMVHRLPLRHGQKPGQTNLQNYLPEDCKAEGSTQDQIFWCDNPTLDASIRRYVRFVEEADFLHIFYMAYRKDFSAQAVQIIDSLRTPH